MEEFTIGKLAAAIGLAIETIRYYEKTELLPPPRRTRSGYRLYGTMDVKRLNFIVMAKSHGFTLKDIKELLELRTDPQSTCAQVKQRAQNKIRHIDEKIAELQRMKNALSRLAASCSGEGPVGECPIIEAFEE